MKALIVDDERLARSEIRRLLVAHPDVEIAGEAVNLGDAVTKARELAPDLLLLDVEMPGGSGFDLLERLDPVPVVIFTTAHDAHAVRAFEVSALDYLLKPIVPARLAVALERARQLIDTAATGPRVATDGAADAAPVPPTASPLDRVFVRDGDLCLFVSLREVPLLESEGNYARLHVGAHQPLLCRSLDYLEARLDPREFFRANRKQLVNLRFVERIAPIENKQLVVALRGGPQVEMSRRQSQRFRERMTP